MAKIDIEYYVNCFKNLNRSKKAGQVAPHKVVLLLAVIELIEKGIIKNEVIELSDELIRSLGFGMMESRATSSSATLHFPTTI